MFVYRGKTSGFFQVDNLEQSQYTPTRKTVAVDLFHSKYAPMIFELYTKRDNTLSFGLGYLLSFLRENIRAKSVNFILKKSVLCCDSFNMEFR